VGTPGQDGNDFGSRLRRRRIELGLSQSDVAGGELSPSYVSLLEAGKRHPTPEVVDQLAARLHCSRDYLVTGADEQRVERARLNLEYAELALRNGEAPDALLHLEATAVHLRELPRELVNRSDRLRAQALEAVGRIEDAVVLLEQLRREAANAARSVDELELTISLIRCYSEAGDLSLAVELGESALERFRAARLESTDAYFRLVSSLIGAYYERGDLMRAVLLSRDAVERVDAEGGRDARAAVYWNASLSAEARGDVSAAVRMAERAVGLLAEQDDARSIARLRVAYGWLLLRTTPPDVAAATRQLSAARDALADVGSAVDRAYCETELGRAALLDGNPEETVAHVSAAESLLLETRTVESAHVLLLKGQALLVLGDSDKALAAYRAADQVLTELGIGRQAAAAWRELGDVYIRMGLSADAATAYQRALDGAGIRPLTSAAQSTVGVAQPGR
jgi:transcriptional regulator with XRE-family HTH domain